MPGDESDDLPGLMSDRILRVRDRIERAAIRAGRDHREIKLLAVSKTVDADTITVAAACGVQDFGENYVQEFRSKCSEVTSRGLELRWHFIGHLQSNKVRDVVGSVSLVHSVDSEKLGAAIASRSRSMDLVSDVLLEIKLDTAPEKFGIEVSKAVDVAAAVSAIEGIRVIGLMGMAPFGSDPEQSRPHFRRLRQVFERLPVTMRQVLSMGMSGDFEVAVEEGSTMLRIGTALFGHRHLI